MRMNQSEGFQKVRDMFMSGIFKTRGGGISFNFFFRIKEARKGFLQLMYMSEQLNIKTLWF